MDKSTKQLLIIGLLVFVAIAIWKMYNVAKAPFDLIKAPFAKAREVGQSLRFWQRDADDDKMAKETFFTKIWKRQPAKDGSRGGIIESITSPIYEIFDTGKSPQVHKTPVGVWDFEKREKKRKEENLTERSKTAKYAQKGVGAIPGTRQRQKGLQREREGIIGYGNFITKSVNERILRY